MHKWGSRTNGPRGIWDSRGSGSQHVLVPATNRCPCDDYPIFQRIELWPLVCRGGICIVLNVRMRKCNKESFLYFFFFFLRSFFAFTEW